MRHFIGSRSDGREEAKLRPKILAGGRADRLCRGASAENDVALKLHNDAAQAIDVYVASEQSQAEKPWVHLQIDADDEGQCTLDSPDRYVVVVQAGGERWRSKRIGLKEFLAAHPGCLLRISRTGYEFDSGTSRAWGGCNHGGAGRERFGATRPAADAAIEISEVRFSKSRYLVAGAASAPAEAPQRHGGGGRRVHRAAEQSGSRPLDAFENRTSHRRNGGAESGGPVHHPN